MLMRVLLVFTRLPTPFLSVLFHHQLHPWKPKGAWVTHRRRKGLRWMGGCDFTCQVGQMFACSRCGLIQTMNNDRTLLRMQYNHVIWVSTFVCYSYRNLANEHESLMQKYLHLLQIVETEKTVAKQLRQQIEDGEIEIERLKSEVILALRHWWDAQAKVDVSADDVLKCSTFNIPLSLIHSCAECLWKELKKRPSKWQLLPK